MSFQLCRSNLLITDDQITRLIQELLPPTHILDCIEDISAFDIFGQPPIFELGFVLLCPGEFGENFALLKVLEAWAAYVALKWYLCLIFLINSFKVMVEYMDVMMALWASHP